MCVPSEGGGGIAQPPLTLINRYQSEFHKKKISFLDWKNIHTPHVKSILQVQVCFGLFSNFFMNFKFACSLSYAGKNYTWTRFMCVRCRKKIVECKTNMKENNLLAVLLTQISYIASCDWRTVCKREEVLKAVTRFYSIPVRPLYLQACGATICTWNYFTLTVTSSEYY